MQREFCIRRSNRNSIVICLICFCAMLVLSLIGSAEAASNQVVFTLMIGGFWALLISAGLVTLVHYARYRLILTHDAIEQRSLLGTKTLSLAAIVSIHWHLHARIVKVLGYSTRMRINLQEFEPEEYLSIIRYFRNCIPEERQEGWQLFSYKCVRPCLPEYEYREPESHEIRVTRARRYWFLFASAVATVTTVVCAAWISSEWKMLLGLVLLVPIWLIIYLATSSEGEIVPRLAGTPADRVFLWTLAVVLVFVLAITVYGGLSERSGWPRWPIYATAASCIAVLMIGASRCERLRNTATLAAAKEWNGILPDEPAENATWQ